MNEVANFEAVTPCGWSRIAVQKFASDAAKTLNFLPGDDIESLVERLGGRISLSDWANAPQTGSITVWGPSHFEVSLNPLSGLRKSRFTIAHELAHYIMHSRFGKKPITVQRDGSGPVEWEANWFATGFLMPEEQFRQKIMEGFGNAELAEYFGVSTEAVNVRRSALSL